MAEVMTDRELLELAAKAPGAGPCMEYMEWDGYRFVEHKVHGVPHCGLNYERTWNPLIDDGDALRLAVKLRIEVGHDEIGMKSFVYARVEYEELNHIGLSEIFDDDSERLWRTRRAIVRAAAEIGKGV
ncbi:hypothetical protein [Aeromonas hydrophila]|uniref:hypothetical protein n=1 Tax=Aeromonas hydrophila TaxID=644 RepID=UPI002361C3BF|nr:hypothetical protein [Aeromonas hydrophila]